MGQEEGKGSSYLVLVRTRILTTIIISDSPSLIICIQYLKTSFNLKFCEGDKIVFLRMFLLCMEDTRQFTQLVNTQPGTGYAVGSQPKFPFHTHGKAGSNCQATGSREFIFAPDPFVSISDTSWQMNLLTYSPYSHFIHNF